MYQSLLVQNIFYFFFFLLQMTGFLKRRHRLQSASRINVKNKQFQKMCSKCDPVKQLTNFQLRRVQNQPINKLKTMGSEGGERAKEIFITRCELKAMQNFVTILFYLNSAVSVFAKNKSLVYLFPVVKTKMSLILHYTQTHSILLKRYGFVVLK